MAIHDAIVHNLEQRLIDSPMDYDVIGSCLEYRVRGKFGECDLFAVSHTRALLIEVKGLDKKLSRLKAYSQLDKDVTWITEKYNFVNRIYTFYAYSSSKRDDYTIMRVNTIRI